eukprot:15150098-Alexandrium_andersonii.AAC.1
MSASLVGSEMCIRDSFDDWPHVGARATKEYLECVVEGPGNLVSYGSQFRQESGIGEGVAALH